MRITDIEILALRCELEQPLRWGSMVAEEKGGVLVRVSTDDGICRIGEAGFSVSHYPMVAPIIETLLKPVVIGEDPSFIARIWEKMFKATHKWGRRGLETYAMSGIDIALWDILGKVSGEPVYKLLGGYQRKVKAYAAPSLRMRTLSLLEAYPSLRKSPPWPPLMASLLSLISPALQELASHRRPTCMYCVLRTALPSWSTISMMTAP